MRVGEADIEQLLAALTKHPWVTRSGVRFSPSAEARFQLVCADTATWHWDDRCRTDRALEGGLAYYDFDQQIVSVVLMAKDNRVTEIELWRGDSLPILTAPRLSGLWEVVPGETYVSGLDLR